MEYARNAVRMSALMGVQNIHVYTHDSIGQGEDGPTHQPVEQPTSRHTKYGPGVPVIRWKPSSYGGRDRAQRWPKRTGFSPALPFIERDAQQIERIIATLTFCVTPTILR